MKHQRWKNLAIVLMIILIGWMVYRAFGRMLPGLAAALKSGDEKEIEKYLSGAGHWDGILCVFLLQFIQVVTIVFPGWTIQMAAGIIYGGFRAFVITFSAYWSANMTVFILIRQMKKNVAADSAENGTAPDGNGEEGDDLPEVLFAGKMRKIRLPKKLKESTFVKRMKKTHPGFAVAMGVLMPGMPNGFIPYVAAQTSLAVKDFALAVASGCFLPILMACYAGHFILLGDYLTGLIFVAVPLLFMAVLYQNQYRIIQFLNSREKKHA